MKCTTRYLLVVITVICISIVGAGHQAFAMLYGRGNYNGCSYQSCPQPTSPTVTTTPSGLQVAVNLTNGQSIPKSGYIVTLTPLNGSGSSFKQADIYINGNLVKTVTPDETGTAKWQWMPDAVGSADIKIVITDTNGSMTTQQYTVNVTNQSASGPSGGSATTKPKASSEATGFGAVIHGISSGVQSATDAAARAVKHLPSPIVHSFPFILFLLLAVDGVLLLTQAQRELHEYRVENELLARARQLNDLKKTFAELVSHYLRTPLTVIQGGVELLSIKGSVHPDAAAIKSVVEDMKSRVQPLILASQAAGQASSPVAVTGDPKPEQVWKQRGLIVPIALIIVVWLLFEYLVGRAGSFSVGQVELFSQAIIFTIAAAAFYLIFRSYKLHKRDTLQLQGIAAKEAEISEAQDKVVGEIIAALGGDIRKLTVLSDKLGDDAAGHSIKNGCQRLQEMLAKFSIATRLKGASSSKPFNMVPLSDLTGDAMKQIQPKLDAKHCTLKLTKDGRVPVRDPELLNIVIASVIDNAVEYSGDTAVVEASLDESKASAQVRIIDHGEGIPEGKSLLLFQPFSKVEGAEVFNHEGMGFSLYLDKLIMMYLGGDISVESKQGHGTTVSITLPLPRAVQ